jgi:hypothetical protein
VSGMSTNAFRLRIVDRDGEILIVRDFNGVNTLTDPITEDIVVVPTGRMARLVRFDFSGSARSFGRDPLTRVIHTAPRNGCDLGFATVRLPRYAVHLQDLSDGQIVDVLPAAENAHDQVAVFRPRPVLHGAVAVQPEVYALAA